MCIRDRWKNGGPPVRLRTEPCARRITEEKRRIERRQVVAVFIMRVLERRPCRVTEKARENDEHHGGLDPPCVAAHGFSPSAAPNLNDIDAHLGLFLLGLC